MFGKLQAVVFVLIVLLCTGIYSVNSTSKLLGRWAGKSTTGEVIKIEFFEDGYTDLYKAASGVFGGKITPAIFWPKFKLEDLENSLAFDFEYYGSKGELKSKVLCAFEFVDENKIKIGFSENAKVRPLNFESSNISETWVLQRVTDDTNWFSKPTSIKNK